MKNLVKWICFLALISLACEQSAAALEVAPTAVAVAIATPEEIVSTPAPSVWMVCAWHLNVRGGPGTGYRVLALLERGDEVTVREWSRNGNGWAMIAPARWVNGDYLKKTDCR